MSILQTNKLKLKHLTLIIAFAISLNCFSQQKTDWQHFILDKKEEGKTENTTSYYLVKHNTFKNAIPTNSSYEIKRVLDNNHFIASTKNPSEIEKLIKPTSILKANNLWKLNANIQNKRSALFTVSSSNGDMAHSYFQGLNEIEIIKRIDDFFIIKTNTSVVEKKLLQQPFVNYIGEEQLSPNTESIVLDMDLTVNNITKVRNEEINLQGSDITISVKDELLYRDDIDLLGKTIVPDTTTNEIGTHATDMATITSGLGNSAMNSFGVAPFSKVASSNFNSLPPDENNYFLENDITIQNHSYGTSIEPFYGALASLYDAQSYELPNILHVFSAGNQGSVSSTEGKYKDLGPIANLTGNFKYSKNTLSVGACNYNNQVIEISSKGPAPDGRIKPELVAYSSFGTSNAAAITAGAAALLQEKYNLLYQDNIPSYLMKAMLIAGADDIEEKGPDYKSGFGKLNLSESLDILKNEQFILDEISASSKKNHTIEIPENTKSIKVTLTWLDPAANPNDNIALVNDLDITATDGTITIYPLILNDSPNENILNQTAKEGVDNKNNIEQIVIENPTKENYTLSVKSNALQTASQKYAIAYHFLTDNSFEWHYPLSSDNVPYNGESIANFKWKSTLSEEIGDLEISFDNGNTWQLIESNINLTKGNYLYNAPNETNSAAKLRIKTSTQTYESPIFTYSFSPRVRVSLNCNDTKEIKWNALKNVDEYQLFRLENNRMAPLTTVKDTSFVIPKIEENKMYYAVAPILENGLLGARSETINVNESENICYINNFLANTDLETSTVSIFTSLNSSFNIESATVFSLRENERIPITTLNTASGSSFVSLDNNPTQGINRYQLEIKLKSGATILSEITTTIFLTDTPFYIFPNPTTNGINVYTKDFTNEKVTFNLFNIAGQLCYTTEITTSNSYVTFGSQPPGVYIVRLKASSGEETIKKIVIK
ncbi:S8 family peptidase [Galbibacter mesophilus]|uniref:S8 family peptidase n=1 Tax=Galbibacter mesophilus TaxID=379069 RepID=UPI00191E24FC|nr:S8 family peptidase [Galbibacter mesophilus]MCM5661557.1 S8 family peptidase [Galbibacter mesophilus]